jgi:hypothetical protein
MMPGLSLEQTTQLELTPQLRTRIQNKLNAYRKADAEYEKAKDVLEALHADLVDLREMAGGDIDFPGYGKVTVKDNGTVKTLDKTKLMAIGVTLAQLTDCTVEKPKKSSVLVTPAGE